MENIFDIRSDNDPINIPEKQSYATGGKKKYDKRTYKKKVYTKDKIKELLKGYIIVTPDKWSDIPISSHVRYIKKDGVFASGGFVTSHWLNKEGKPFIHLANSFKKNNSGYATWPVAHESVSIIYKKVDPKSNIEMDVVRIKTAEIIGQINILADIVKQQKIRQDSQDADIKQLYSIINKLSKK